METQWYYIEKGQRLGPFSSDELKQLAGSGRLQRSDTVWKQGMPQWVPASHIKGLFSAAVQAHTPGKPPPSPGVPSSPAPSAAPAPSATPPKQPPVAGTRACEWCAESIREEALKCPRCQKWRRDIAEDRRAIIKRLVAACLLLCVAVCVFSVNMKESSAQPSPFSSSQMSGVWHDKIETRQHGAWPHVDYEFSISKFLTSFAGWAVIGFGLFGVLFGYAARCAERRFRQKTGLRWNEIW
jgi:hypothetical protein